MDNPTTTMTVERIDPLFSPSEQLALAGFLAGYSGLTRDAYALDLRQYVAWCSEHNLTLFAVRRADIECFGRELEARGKARATVARRLTTIVGLYLRRGGGADRHLPWSPRSTSPRRHGVPRSGA